ncbi:MAG: DNA double-strand break repair nuclease NurA, partial [Anaerolineae bacterium]
VVALADGPLLPWMPQRLTDPEQGLLVKRFAAPLDDLRASYAVPLGYVDRPRSANVLRLLHLAELPVDAISKERLRQDNPYDGLSDAALFQDLLPGQRSSLFATTSEINQNFRQLGHRICFCYMNVASEPGERNASLARIEVPEWIARDPERLEAALAAVWSDCRLLDYPYLLTRAHELALVTRQERTALEQMLRTEMMRRGLWVEESPKANTKRFVGGR